MQGMIENREEWCLPVGDYGIGTICKFSLTEKFFASCRNNGTILVWDVENRQEFCQFGGMRIGATVTMLEFTSDDKYLICICDGHAEVFMFSLATRNSFRVFYEHGREGVTCFRDLGDSAQLLIVGEVCRRITVWNVRTGRRVDRLALPDVPRAISPDGTLVLVGSDRTAAALVRRREGRMVECVHRFHGCNVFGAEFSADGRRLAILTANSDLRVFDTVSGEQLACFVSDSVSLAGAAARWAFAASGLHFALFEGRHVRVFAVDSTAQSDTDSLRELCRWQHTRHPQRIALSAHSVMLALESAEPACDIDIVELFPAPQRCRSSFQTDMWCLAAETTKRL